MSGTTIIDRAVDVRTLRDAFSNFVTGVTIVTTVDSRGSPRGLTANSFSSVSLDPALLSICIGKTSSTFAAFESGGGFSVNILSEHQRSVAEQFARKSADRFRGIGWSLGSTGAPRIDGSLVQFDCETHGWIEAGDHFILLGLIKSLTSLPNRPLIFGQGNFLPVAIQQAAVQRPALAPVLISYIVEWANQVLMKSTNTRWELPTATLSPTDRTAAQGEMGNDIIVQIGAAAVKPSFLYSVYDDPKGSKNVVYRALLQDLVHDAGYQLFTAETVPWDALASPEVTGILTRFFRERQINQYGIYVGTASSGHVAGQNGTLLPFRDYISNL